MRPWDCCCGRGGWPPQWPPPLESLPSGLKLETGAGRGEPGPGAGSGLAGGDASCVSEQPYSGPERHSSDQVPLA